MIDREKDDYSDIVEVVNSNLIEFILDRGLSLYYNEDDENWTLEFTDLEDGTELEEDLDISKLPIRLGDSYTLTIEEFETYESVVKGER